MKQRLLLLFRETGTTFIGTAIETTVDQQLINRACVNNNDDNDDDDDNDDNDDDDDDNNNNTKKKKKQVIRIIRIRTRTRTVKIC